MKILHKMILILLSLILFCSPASATGFYTRLTDDTYDTASDFYRGMALVARDGQYAVIDKTGAFVLPFDTRAKVIRKNGLIMVMGENGCAGFYDSTGRQVTDFIYDTYHDTHEKTGVTNAHYFTNRYDGDGQSDLIPISRNKKFGFINSRGEEQIPPTFEYVHGFSDGIARICSGSEVSKYGTYINCKYGFIREDGTVVLPADTYWYIGDFKNGYAAGGNGPSQMIDKNGNIRDLGGLVYESNNGIYIIVRDAEGRSGVLDMNGNTVLPLDFTTKGLCGALLIIEGTRLITPTGETIYTAPAGGGLRTLWEDEAAPFVKVSVPAGDVEAHTLTGLIRTDGTEILPPIYETVSVLGEGLIYGQTRTENFLFDYNGNLICTLHGNFPGLCREGLFSLQDFDTMDEIYVKNPLRDVTVLYNGTPILFPDTLPRIESGRTLIPLRAVFEGLEAEVNWEDSTKTVYIDKGDTHIVMPVGASVFTKNGVEIPLDVPAAIENGRTLIPLRAVADALGCTVDWDGSTRTVLITI